MSRRQPPRRFPWALLGLAAVCGLLNGCVYRQFTVTTSFPGAPQDAGAIVQVNGKIVGPTPVDVPFIHYGTYLLTISRDGAETLVVKQDVPAPWYEYWPLEFISEVLIPWNIEDKRRFHFDLKPLQVPPAQAILDPANSLREQGKGIGTPVASPIAPVAVPAFSPPPPNLETLPAPNPVLPAPSQAPPK